MTTPGAAGDGDVAPKAPGPFAVATFREIWFASLFSNFGILIQSIGAAWLMTSLTHSPVMVALVQSSTVFPIMLLSLLAGAIADNLNRRRVMLTSQIFMFAMSVLLVTCAFMGVLTPVSLLAFTFLIGCGVAINAPSVSASIGDIVPRPLVPAAVALNSLGFNVARSVGPAIGGVIVASLGSAAAFLGNAMSYLPMIAVLSRWRPAYPEKTLPREPIGAAIRSGVRYVAMSPHLRTVILRATYFGIFASGVSALMPLIARDLIGGGAGTFGLLSASFGVGSVGGAFLTARLRRKLTSENMVRVAAAALAIGTAVVAVSPSLPLTMVALVVGGAGWVLALSTFNILVQMASPRWVVGRALSFYQMGAFGAMAIGSWIIGLTTERIGVSTTLILLAIVQASNLPFGLLFRLQDVRSLDLDPLVRDFAPETVVPVSGRSGPVVIGISYTIAERDIPEFLAVMSEYRRIRRRDGATGWTLMRDLGDAERWIERFHVATWVDYLRHVGRRTKDDMACFSRLEALHIGPERPQVTRLLERQATPPVRGRPDEPIDETPNLI